MGESKDGGPMTAPLNLDEALKRAAGSAHRCSETGTYLPSAHQVLTEDVPALVAEIKRLRKELEAAAEVYDEVCGELREARHNAAEAEAERDALKVALERATQ
jgi:hypothetical protein